MQQLLLGARGPALARMHEEGISSHLGWWVCIILSEPSTKKYDISHIWEGKVALHMRRVKEEKSLMGLDAWEWPFSFSLISALLHISPSGFRLFKLNLVCHIRWPSHFRRMQMHKPEKSLAVWH